MDPPGHIPRPVEPAQLHTVRDERKTARVGIQQAGLFEILPVPVQDLQTAQIDALEIREYLQEAVRNLCDLCGGLIGMHLRHQRKECSVSALFQKRRCDREEIDHHQIGCPGSLEGGKAVKDKERPLFLPADLLMYRHREMAEAVIQADGDLLRRHVLLASFCVLKAGLSGIVRIRYKPDVNDLSSRFPDRTRKGPHDLRKVRQITEQKNDARALRGGGEKLCEIIIRIFCHEYTKSVCASLNLFEPVLYWQLKGIDPRLDCTTYTDSFLQTWRRCDESLY